MTTRIRWMVTLLSTLDSFESTRGNPLRFEDTHGIVGFLPVFDDYEKAKAWSKGRGEIRSITETIEAKPP